MAFLQNWKDQARAHWKEHLPARTARLEKNGTLEKALDQAVDRTFLEKSQLEDAGLDPETAFQEVRQRYLFPPEETPKRGRSAA